MSIYEIDSISFHQTECICLLLKRQIPVCRVNNSRKIFFTSKVWQVVKQCYPLKIVF